MKKTKKETAPAPAPQAVTVNEGQRLFVIPCGTGFSCLGFDVERAQTRAILAELGKPAPVAPSGTLAAYAEHGQAIEAARQYNKETGKRLLCGLHPALIGKEGKRIECTLHGARARFIVGKSTGFLPCHLEIERRGNSGGGAINPGAELGLVRVIG